MPPLNDWRAFADQRLDDPAAVLDFLAHAAPAIPRSRVVRLADLLAGPVARWATRPTDVRRIAATLQRLPIAPGTQRLFLTRAEVADARFARYLTRPAPLPGGRSRAAQPTPGEAAAARWMDLPPQVRTRALDELLASLEGWTGGPPTTPRRGGRMVRARHGKSHLVDHVAEIAGIGRANAARVVDALFETSSGIISRAVHGAGSLSLPGFGKFTLKSRAARQGRNPRTGVTIDIPERSTIGFSAGKALREGTGGGRRRAARTEGASGGHGFPADSGGGYAAGGTGGGGYGGLAGDSGEYGSGGGYSGLAGYSGGYGYRGDERAGYGWLERTPPSGGSALDRPGADPEPQGRPKRREKKKSRSGGGSAKSASPGAEKVSVPPRRRRRTAESAPPPGPPILAAPVVSGPAQAESAPPPAGAPQPAPLRTDGTKPKARAARTVSNGFAAGPGRGPLPPETTLQAGAEYAFWLQVGGRVKGSIATGGTELDTRSLQTGSLIDVVLFPVGGGGFQVLADLGRLRLEADGTVAVARQPGVADEPSATGLRARRLFFPVRAPEAAGEHRLRCNLYHGQTLLQSWLVRARVTAQSRPQKNALRSAPDYVLSHALDPARLESLSTHRLSVLMNGNGDGTHSFFFKGAEDYRRPATLDADQLQDLIETGRGALRKAAWADDQPWTPGKPYVYGDGKRDLERLRADLERLARRGCDFYDALIGEFADGYSEEDRLQQLMRRPGMVQIASRESATHVVPAALFYDRTALDRGSPAEFTLCPAFLQALDDPRPLEEHPCFQGDCVSFAEPEVVCPSGFWGFRHALGMPLSVGETAPDVDEALAYADAPGMAVAVWRDFTRRAQHEAVLRTLRPDLVWQYADTRKAALSLLASTRSPVVYFYCHGGMEKNVPYLLVGGQGEGFIAPSSFRGRIRWTEPRPLVFINGCETGALEPETALDLVSALVERANASGVIGTEITIFEPLACEFAEEFLRRFVVQQQRLGEAVRGARLALLKRGNPLGLVYIPFAIAGLHLVKRN